MNSGTGSESVAVLILGLSIPNYSSLSLDESWVPGQDPGKYGCLVTSRLSPSSSQSGDKDKHTMTFPTQLVSHINATQRAAKIQLIIPPHNQG